MQRFKHEGTKVLSYILCCLSASSSIVWHEQVSPQHTLDRMFFKSLAIASLALLAEQASAAFGITTSDASYVIDAGSSNPLKFTVNRKSCDINSINYYGSELQYQSTGSHIGSGLGSATVSATESGGSRNKISVGKCPDQYRRLHQGDLRNLHLDTLLCCPQGRFNNSHGNIHICRLVFFVLWRDVYTHGFLQSPVLENFDISHAWMQICSPTKSHSVMCPLSEVVLLLRERMW